MPKGTSLTGRLYLGDGTTSPSVYSVGGDPTVTPPEIVPNVGDLALSDNGKQYAYTGTGWVEVGTGGVPAPHAASHESGGADELIADTTAVTMPVADSNKGFTFEVNVSVRSTGAAGTVLSNGAMTRMATTLAVVPFNVLSGGVPSTATVNTATTQLLTVTATWSAADPTNTITLTNLIVTA